MTQQTYPIALITGAARRVGADLCRTLQKNNYTVVIHYNQSETAALALADVNTHIDHNRVVTGKIQPPKGYAPLLTDYEDFYTVHGLL